MAEPSRPAEWAHLVVPNKREYVRGARPPVDCILCAVLERHPAVERLEIFRTALWAVSANLYPYNPGHLLLFPVRHVTDVRQLRRKEERELADVQACALDVLEAAYEPTGFNIGYNLGRSGGASVEHLHVHVVPRYESELGFLDLLSHTRTYVEEPRSTVKRLRRRFARAWPR